MKNKDQIMNTVKVIVLAAVLTVGMQYAAAQVSWTAPVASPPQQNTYAPLNVGETMQIKNGGLTVAAAAVSGSGLAVLNGTTILDAMRFASVGVGAATTNYIQSGAGRTVGTWAPLKFGAYGSTDSKAVIDASGNFGIGSNITPTAKLDVDGAIRVRGGGTPAAGMVLTAADNLGNATWQTPSSSGGSLPTGSANQTLRYTGTAWQASPTITNTGTNVGIGVTNPAARLDVGGTVKISGGNPGAGKVLTSDDNGLASWATPTVVSNITGPTNFSGSNYVTRYAQCPAGKVLVGCTGGYLRQGLGDSDDNESWIIIPNIANRSCDLVHEPDVNAATSIQVHAFCM